MKRAFRNILLILSAVGVLLAGLYVLMAWQTKLKSPETTEVYSEDGAEITVQYSRPQVDGREIFGGLVPYERVWRTGANEATEFSTNVDLKINGQLLPAGDYTLWTIPGRYEWEVIWNRKSYTWGIGANGKAAMDPQFNVLSARAIPSELVTPVDTFTIDVSYDLLTLTWDRTRVQVNMQIVPSDI